MAAVARNLLTALAYGVPFGLVTGLRQGWAGAAAVAQGAIFGMLMAAATWLRPARPKGVSEDVWDALRPAQRRAVLAALARHEPLPETISGGRRRGAASMDRGGLRPLHGPGRHRDTSVCQPGVLGGVPRDRAATMSGRPALAA